MNRIFFAAGNGARVQGACEVHKALRVTREWRSVASIDLRKGAHVSTSYRIHPEDVDLQYGVISRAMRKSVISGKLKDRQACWEVFFQALRFVCPEIPTQEEKDAVEAMSFGQTEFTHLLFCELLADLGL